ncbi:hypoxanthine phosphoribosyltransferase [Sulfobacillus acidophilus TPY]|uniref:Hypoxanthine phosphoribosyltransferase n=1 Tax=Sulfobacillus acidophilus (strain ATCC 700253 / DSM 10332 / NAL) TaxID=679936 RepID=G8TXD8_SULAD|nr:hypoxanthine phosphoribosyltransferase [Sulfobacillus acidophilus TPY]AEW06140.1 hypoxanthine phosphoribosyltransferase [Sulfobacillus acidophilus DSM 10332]MCY0863521.1 hypoxanthine phosphoribosyltransferase [Sulfobacillus sp.]
MQTLPGERLEVLLSARDIQARVEQLGRRITLDYQDKSLVLIGILKGSFVFVADLARAIDLPLAVDFMAVSSYGHATKSSGVVRILKDLDYSLDGKHVIVVEDIVDTGLTLNYIYGHVRSRGAMSVKICALLDKPARRQVAVPVHYKGFEIPDEFVVGYGLDVDERYRNLSDVCRLVRS